MKQWKKLIGRKTGVKAADKVKLPNYHSYENNGKLQHISEDIILEMLSFLPAHDLCNMSFVNTFMYHLSQNNKLWSNIFHVNCHLNYYRNLTQSETQVFYEDHDKRSDFKEMVASVGCLRLMDHPLSSSFVVRDTTLDPHLYKYSSPNNSSDILAISRRGVSKPGVYLFRTLVLKRKPGCAIGVAAMSDLPQMATQLNRANIDHFNYTEYFRDGSVGVINTGSIIDRIRPDEDDPTISHKVFFPYEEHDIVALLVQIHSDLTANTRVFVNGEECVNVVGMKLADESDAFHFHYRLTLGTEFRALETVCLNGEIDVTKSKDQQLEEFARKRKGVRRVSRSI